MGGNNVDNPIESTNRHAYLIMAYNQWNQLKKLLELLDDYRNDIYVHIDLKSSDFPQKMLEDAVKQSKIIFIPRKKVFWADYSQADVEMDLMEAARKNEKYRYYHLMSGADLPLKSQDELHEFFDKETHEFIAMTPDGGEYVENHARYYHFFLHNNIYRKCKPLKLLDRCVMYVQKGLGLKRKFGRDLMISTGWQWFSITDWFCEYVLSQREFIEKMFRYVLDVDEKFIGTMVNKCGCQDRLYHVCPAGGEEKDYMIGSQRLIDWHVDVPRPYTWGRTDTQKDFDTLMNSGYLFARKFNEDVNPEIIDMIYNKIKGTKNQV